MSNVAARVRRAGNVCDHGHGEFVGADTNDAADVYTRGPLRWRCFGGLISREWLGHGRRCCASNATGGSTGRRVAARAKRIRV
jgi:hypothetical protein